MVATKDVDKVRLTKYSKSLTNGNLKSTSTIEQVHLSFQIIEPTNLGLEPCIVCGNWYPYMDIETTSCVHLCHPNCLNLHFQEFANCKKCGKFQHPLWFDSKSFKCMDKVEYDKQHLTLGTYHEVKLWLDHHQTKKIHLGESWPCLELCVLISFVHFLAWLFPSFWLVLVQMHIKTIHGCGPYILVNGCFFEVQLYFWSLMVCSTIHLKCEYHDCTWFMVFNRWYCILVNYAMCCVFHSKSNIIFNRS